MVNSAAPIPQDMRDLLIRLDQQVKDGFANVNQKLDNIERRADGHEARIRDLESWRSEIQGGAKGVGLGWKFLLALGSLLAGAGTVLGVQAIQPQKPADMIKSEVTVERHVSVPVKSRLHD